MPEGQQAKFSMRDLRQKYPKAGLRWTEAEDRQLKAMYEEWRKSGGDFDAFLPELINKFQRATGGLKARLAKYFTDVPGWDYGRDEFRKVEFEKRVNEQLGTDHDDFLRQEYGRYVSAKQETYLSFLKRLGLAIGGVEGALIRHRLEQLVGPMEKHKREDIKEVTSRPSRQPEAEIPKIDLTANPEMREAIRVMNKTGSNLFLTGEAGTGKSTLLQYFRRTTEKNVVVLAPTGVAALNVEGQTIHSFCGFGPDITTGRVKKLAQFSPKFKLLQKLQAVIIDEISMVRADLLDCVDKFLKLNGPAPHEPFGGIQMIFIGDLYQLPPVEKDFGAVNQSSDGQKVMQYSGRSSKNSDNSGRLYASPYFFDSRAFKSSHFNYIQLKTVYRQKEQVFLEVLNAVRNNAASAEHLTVLNRRAAVADNKFTFEKFAIYLTPHNARAKKVNDFFLEKIKAEPKIYTGRATGKFEDRELPTDLELEVKIGAQVMMLNNDYKKRWVNGTMGKIVGIEKGGIDHPNEGFIDHPDLSGQSESGEFSADLSSETWEKTDEIVIELETGESVYVEPHTWEMFQFSLDKSTQKIDSRTTGTFTQYPFKLAWAVTIHKAQGKSFDKVYVDLSTGTFAHGQLYVALSRCRTLDGLYLKRPVTQADIILDQRIVEFLHSFTPGESYYSSAEE